MLELNKINDSLADFEEELSKLKSASEMIEEANNISKITISESIKIIEKLILNSKQATDSAINESKKLNDSAKKLFTAVYYLNKKLDKVDFPTRLDKLDNSVTGINTAIQNIFGRFETVEKNLLTRLDKLDNSVTEINTAIQNIFGRFETAEKNLKDEFNLKLYLLQEKLQESQKLNLVFLIFILLLVGSSFFTLLVKFVF